MWEIESLAFVTAGDDCIKRGGTCYSALHVPNFQRFTAECNRTTGQHLKCRENSNLRRNNEQLPT